jgi:hypothetical protein
MSNNVHVKRASVVAIGLASLLAATIVLIGCTKKDDASTSPTPATSTAAEALSGSAGPHHMGRAGGGMHDEDGGRHHGEHGDKDDNK